MDLDGLKKINDRYGHLVGSLALRRVAETLLGSCRGSTPPRASAGRVRAGPARDRGRGGVARGPPRRRPRGGGREQPPLSVSVGVAVHPRDGATLEALLNAADRSLYDSKARRRGRTKRSRSLTPGPAPR